MVSNKITLIFQLERGKPIDQYYFSARIKLTDESKIFLREKIGDIIQFDKLDDHFDLDPKNFYIYNNNYGFGNRDELYVKDSDGKYLTGNLPLNYYKFSVDLSDPKTIDYGFYYLYDKECEKAFDDNGKLKPIISSILNSLLNNTSNLNTQDIFLQIQNKIAEEEMKLVREKREAEREFDQKNEELKKLIDTNEIEIFKVIKGSDIGNGRSEVILQLNDKKQALEPSKYYIAKYEDDGFSDEFMHYNDRGYDTLIKYDDLFFVLNNSSYSDLESGFYSMPENLDDHVKHFNTSNQYFSDDQLSEKLSKLQGEGDKMVMDTHSSYVEQSEEVTVEKPKSEHRISKREIMEENEEAHKIVSPDLDAKDSHGYTALHKAVFSKCFDEVKSLIEQGANVDVQDKHEITPLSYAVMNNDGTMVRFLIEKGNASVNLGKYNNPLSMAISREYTELAEYLIKKGADVNHQNSIGRTLLHKTAEDGNVAMVKFLVEKGARLDVLDKWNDTPLHVAANVQANKGHLEVVSYLIKEGADVNLTNNYTPIHLAITRGNLDMVKCLMDNGADLYIKRACDGTPFAYAKQQGQTEIVKYMDSVMSNLLHNKTVSFDGADISIKYDLANNKLGMIEKSIKDAMQDFKSAFNTSGHHREVNVYVFNTRDDYKAYLKKVGIDIGDGAVGYTKMIDLSKGNAADVYVYLDSRGNLDQYVLEHEIGHAMHFANLGLSYILPKAMHEAIANYTAGLENGEHVNDHEDIKALSEIHSKSLKPDEILRNDYQGEYYYSEAEQVVKFLEYKHSDLIDNLLKNLSVYGYSDRPQANKLVEDFLTTIKGYDQEFKEWVADQISSKSSLANQKSVDAEQMQADSSMNIQSSDDQIRSNRSSASDENQEKSVTASVIEGMNAEKDSSDLINHPLKVKIGNLIETGKYKVNLCITYDEMKNFYDTILNKYHISKEYNREQVMVLYNNIITPASRNYDKQIILDNDSYIKNDHLFIQNQDFGDVNSFNEMFYLA
ncbi:ankyrin repeat domain-containing protein [Wolbachia endosymbiont of Pentidionis agamae]|uniref:ankyrin repeat domain-containing protein n=1 Tax=Wolbachia endosymbiont of Pentidionis agamae TaxID=3110435 RepID=UPI002FCFF233